MADILIRDIPDEILATIDLNARRLGVSRTEYLRRHLASLAATSTGKVTVDDLAQFASAFADLADPDIMAKAWE
jgi:hypothetical protein